MGSMAINAALEPPRDALLARMEARAAERGYPISDPEVGTFLAVAARAAAPRFIVELGANIGHGAIVLARAAGARERRMAARDELALLPEVQPERAVA